MASGLHRDAAKLPPPHEFERPREFKDASGRSFTSVIGLQDAIDQLRRLEKPFLNWAGKAERLSFKVPTLPLFIHERLSTKGILATLKGHLRDRQMELDLYGDPQHSIHDQILKAYEHQNGLGQSHDPGRLARGHELAAGVMKVWAARWQMILYGPAYGISLAPTSSHLCVGAMSRTADDDDMTREPEMVKAYRDTWISAFTHI